MSTKRARPSISYWLVKAEPEPRLVKGRDVSFPIQRLQTAPNQTCTWDGVRNYEARNQLRAMQVGDLALYYHSNCKSPHVAGLVKVTREAYPDPSANDPNHPYFDAKGRDWSAVDVQLVEVWKRTVSLQMLKEHAQGELQGMALLKRPRLSVQPVDVRHFEFIRGLAEEDMEKNSDEE